MKTISRKQAREAIKEKGITATLRIPKNTLTAKQRKFAEKIVLEGLTASDAYRESYNTNGKPAVVNPEASRLANSPKIAATIAALEEAKLLAASQTAEALKSLVVSTLVDVATNSDKDSVRVAAVKTLGTVVGVDMFRETKRIETVKDSDSIRSQILDQLKSMMLSSDDAVDVDANDLLTELVGSPDDPTPPAPPQNQNGTPAANLHSIPHEQSQSFSDGVEQSPQFSEDPPLSLETPTPQGDIFLENGK